MVANEQRAQRLRVGLSRARACTGIVVILVATACGQSDANTPRTAWEKSIRDRISRDYAAFWDSLAGVSKQEVQRVLLHVKGDPQYLDSIHKKLNVPVDQLQNMDDRAFFLALMRAVERNIPGVLDLQLREARGARYVREEVKEDRAVVYWESAQGKQAYTLLLFEGGAWKPVLRR